MRFSTALALLAPAGAALAQTTWTIVVGNNSELTFSPPQITNASEGDILQFIFASKNHTATQSSFADPCTELSPPGFDTSFQPVSQNVTTTTFPGNTTALPEQSFTLSNLTGPLWFYCQQTNPVVHCQKGMVFAVNPTANKTFAAFQAAANATGGNATTTNGTSSSAPPAPASSTSAAATTTQSSPAGALRAGTAGVLLSGVGLLALAL